MSKVTIIQRILPHYRVPFFKAMHESLSQEGIELRLFYGQEYPGDVPKTVDLGEDWAIRIKNRYFRISGNTVVWQSCPSVALEPDLLIFEQANALILNHWLVLRRRFKPSTLIAFWGHGANRQATDPNSLSERFKQCMTRRVDWWFAYTSLTSNLVRQRGFPDSHITIVNNTIDSRALRKQIETVTDLQVTDARKRLNLEPTNKIGVYSGGLYSDKRLGDLIEASKRIYSTLPNFRLLIIGDGPERGLIEIAASENAWLHYLGPLYGRDKAVYLKFSDVLLMPGLVGLVVIDSFSAGVPLFTLEASPHSPEIAYIEHGTNGFVVSGDLEQYAQAVVRFLSAPEEAEKVKLACSNSMESFTLEQMVDRFCSGVVSCLNQRKHL